MAEEPQRSWWTTMPGILTGIAGLITALTGLIVALNQLGVLGSDDAPAPPTVAATGSATSRPTVTPSATATTGSQPGQSPAAGASTYTVDFPLNEVYASGTVAYSVLEATAAPATDGQLLLSFLIRVKNSGRYDIGLWDRTFRVEVGDDIYAPTSGLNKVIPGDSTGNGTLTFVIPDDTTQAALKIQFDAGDRTIPFTIARTS